MTLPPLEPRSHTLDALDACTRRLDHAREAVLSEVAYLGGEIDRLRAELARVKAERDQAIDELRRVLREVGR